jgi:hypothetical protein
MQQSAKQQIVRSDPMVRALLGAVASLTAALALAAPAASEPLPAPCTNVCTYHQLSDEDEWGDEDEWDDEGDWDGGWEDPFANNPLGITPDVSLCGGFETAIPFVPYVGECLPLVG